ncbi:hypothetical protein BDW72DRAFT_143720 [Aspergillus terricola var. indicus]
MWHMNTRTGLGYGVGWAGLGQAWTIADEKSAKQGLPKASTAWPQGTLTSSSVWRYTARELGSGSSLPSGKGLRFQTGNVINRCGAL